MKCSRFALGLLCIGALMFNSCVKQKFDTPPDTTQLDPKVPVNLTIAQLNNIALAMSSGTFRTLGDSTIYGVVTADDRSGNFYKNIIIQDSTGGICVAIAATSLYNDYPIGRKIYVKLKGLTVVNYHGLPEVALSAVISSGGSTSVTGLPTSLLTTYIVKGSYPNTVVPLKMRLDDLITNYSPYLNMLVEIEGMEVDSTNVGLQYAAPSLLAIATSRILHPCPNPNNTSLALYNSGYATFQPAILPAGKGNITGIFSFYNSIQFLIRDSSDVKLNGSRECR